MPAINKEKCICQICTCGEHRCALLKSSEGSAEITKTEDKNKVSIENKIADKESAINDESQCYQQKEKCRKQWETSPDQIQEITRSLSQINGFHSNKTYNESINKKSCVSDNQVNRSLLPPISGLSDSDSGKEETHGCICERLKRSNIDFKGMDERNNVAEPQWVVTRPKRIKPKDNLRLEGPMDMETTFKTTYDSTAKQINESLTKNVAIVKPSSNSEENSVEKQRQTNISYPNAIKSSKKKSKHRPNTSLKAGGDGYFNTISKESYKNFVIINDASKINKRKTNGKKSSVCCKTVANIKLPKVHTNNKEEEQTNRTQSQELKSTEIEEINRSMHRMTTEENKVESTNNISHRPERNGEGFKSSIKSSNENFVKKVEDSHENNKLESVEKYSQTNEPENTSFSTSKGEISWTIGSLEEPKRFMTRDIDNIKDLGILDGPNGHSIQSKQIVTKGINDFRKTKVDSDKDNKDDSNRTECNHYVKTQRRHWKHKNECSMRLFQGDMNFSTTNETSFPNNSPNRAQDKTKSSRIERRPIHTAGKRTRKSGRKPNLFRTSTESEFCQTIADKTQKSMYQNQFAGRLYCPALDLGSNKSDFKYKGESSGHKFFLPLVKY